MWGNASHALYLAVGSNFVKNEKNKMNQNFNFNFTKFSSITVLEMLKPNQQLDLFLMDMYWFGSK
jgi:hypothetical protein